eukprot:GHVS01007132.1.p3 GENE.GHVS01007132.1~~GHVS01007132.1.p3  ORF type:complete len:119 (-),score=4.67 GHVS01007132.1:486-842(-)
MVCSSRGGFSGGTRSSPGRLHQGPTGDGCFLITARDSKVSASKMRFSKSCFQLEEMAAAAETPTQTIRHRQSSSTNRLFDRENFASTGSLDSKSKRSSHEKDDVDIPEQTCPQHEAPL